MKSLTRLFKAGAGWGNDHVFFSGDFFLGPFGTLIHGEWVLARGKLAAVCRLRDPEPCEPFP